MSKPDFNLRITTAWLQAKIQGPGAEPQNQGTPHQAVEDMVEGSEHLSAVERLAIYQRAYYYRLLECLRAQFPVLLHFLEDELFAHFAVDYLRVYPSRSYSLYELGAHFPSHLAATRPDKDLSPEQRDSWPDFIIELAQLERTFYEVYDGPGAEQAALLPMETFLQLNNPDDLVIHPVPCLRLLAFHYPVIDYFRAVRAKGDPVLPDPKPTFLLITRKDYVVRTHLISQQQYHLLQLLLAGQSLGDALQDNPIEQKIAVAWIRQWIDQGFFLEP